MKSKSKKKHELLVVPAAPTPISLVEPILTPEELAQEIKVPVSSIYEMTRNRKNGRTPMPKLKAGKVLRFRLSDVVRWMQENGKAA
jgi:predicted DNA-binding transcriptional regulator AlpA